MNQINGTTRVCGLIGNPVEHSISPLIHNMLAELTGIDLVYTTFKVEAGTVNTAVRGAHALNILGMNVTVPHKQEVLDALTEIDPLAKGIGAVNTLVRTQTGYKGYNTDILGLARELQEADIELEGKDVVILGAGGASRAITFLCVNSNAKSVTILNRTVEKAVEIAKAVNTYLKKETARGMAIAEYEKIGVRDYIVIQTSSVGLYPHNDSCVIEDKAFYDAAAVGVDIIYNPAKTKFMKLMEASGHKAYNGLKMLLYQGVSAYELWNDCQITQEQAAQVYDRMKKELGITDEE